MPALQTSPRARSLFAAGLLLATGTVAHADAGTSPFAHDTSFTLGVNAMRVVDSDEVAVDLRGAHAAVALEGGFRIRYGTEAFVSLGVGLGGKEGLFNVSGAGLRQHLRFGRAEPYIQTGVFSVGDGDSGPTAIALGAGIDYRLTPTWTAGIAGGHYFSDDSDAYGSLDWYATARLMWRTKL